MFLPSEDDDLMNQTRLYVKTKELYVKEKLFVFFKNHRIIHINLYQYVVNSEEVTQYWYQLILLKWKEKKRKIHTKEKPFFYFVCVTTFIKFYYIISRLKSKRQEDTRVRNSDQWFIIYMKLYSQKFILLYILSFLLVNFLTCFP